MSALQLQSPIGEKDAAHNSCLKQKTKKICNWHILFLSELRKNIENREIITFFRF